MLWGAGGWARCTRLGAPHPPPPLRTASQPFEMVGGCATPPRNIFQWGADFCTFQRLGPNPSPLNCPPANAVGAGGGLRGGRGAPHPLPPLRTASQPFEVVGGCATPPRNIFQWGAHFCTFQRLGPNPNPLNCPLENAVKAAGGAGCPKSTAPPCAQL